MKGRYQIKYGHPHETPLDPTDLYESILSNCNFFGLGWLIFGIFNTRSTSYVINQESPRATINGYCLLVFRSRRARRARPARGARGGRGARGAHRARVRGARGARGAREARGARGEVEAREASGGSMNPYCFSHFISSSPTSSSVSYVVNVEALTCLKFC